MSGDKNNGAGDKGRDLDYQQSGGKKGSTFQTYRDGKAIGVDTELKKKIEDQKEDTFKNYHKPPRPDGFINNRLNAFEQSSFAKWTGKVNRTYFSDKVLNSNKAKKNIGYTKAEFRNLSLDEQNKVYSEYMSNRMSGATDAYGNVKTGWSKDATGNWKENDNSNRQTYTVEEIAQQNQAEETETEVKITEDEYKKRRGLKGSRSMFGNAGGRGYFDPA
tara:strand:- start:4323 stop:4976 length:654 start_codon:yes stop_codon:yes gene_type:complete